MKILEMQLREVVTRSGRTRRVESGECTEHPGSMLPACRHCLIDARVEGDRRAVADWYAAVQGEECDQRIPEVFRDARVGHPGVTEWVRQWAEEPGASPWLVLSGPVGVGKTHESYAALRAAATSGHPLTWEAHSAGEIYASLRPTPGVSTEARMRAYQTTGLLLVDDLGATKASEWVEETTHRLINYRYERRLPVIITTNVLISEMTHVIGDRITSRLAQMSQVVRMTGPDRRRKNTKGDQK